MDSEAIISELIGGMYPQSIPVGPRLRRNWIARMVEPLPGQAALSNMQQTIEDACFATIEAAYASSVTPEQLSRVRPSILLVRLDDLHLLIRIDFAGPEISVGDAAAIAQWGTLQTIDREIEIDDLQGLPSASWFFLRLGRAR